MTSKLLIFILLNFAALALGSLFTGSGVSSDWYVSLAKAPWTPPGWVFGAAWTAIMICFSFYMTYAWAITENKKNLIILYAIQWVLNVAWNPTFFYYNKVSTALFIMFVLTILIGYFLLFYWQTLKLKSILILPYFIWLLIATSLNLYILMYN